MDQRDSITWVAVELSPQGEKLPKESLDRYLRKDLKVDKDFSIFYPSATYIKNGKTLTLHLLEGYVFLESQCSDHLYFALERRFYINQVISRRLGLDRVLSVIPDYHIQKMKDQLRVMVNQGLSVGDWVLITEGSYSALDGIILEILEHEIAVEVKLRSIDLILLVPRVFVEVL